MVTVAMVSSASALLAMLNENHPVLKLHALSNLNTFVDYFWPEISTSVPTIESLYEDEEFDQRQLAALVVSKLNYDRNWNHNRKKPGVSLIPNLWRSGERDLKDLGIFIKGESKESTYKGGEDSSLVHMKGDTLFI